jgi:hypothetical protein
LTATRCTRLLAAIQFVQYQDALEEGPIRHYCPCRDIDASRSALSLGVADGAFDFLRLVLFDYAKRFAAGLSLHVGGVGSARADGAVNLLQIPAGTDLATGTVRRQQERNGARNADEGDDLRVTSEQVQQTGAAEDMEIHGESIPLQ